MSRNYVSWRGGVKSKNPAVEQQETCPPTHITLAGAILEVLTLEKESAGTTMDVVSAYPQAQEKGGEHERAPLEFVEAAKGYKSVMGGLVLGAALVNHLLQNVSADAYERRPGGASRRDECEMVGFVRLPCVGHVCRFARVPGA